MSAFELHEVQRPGTSVAAVLRPSSIEEAIRLLSTRPNSRVIAGGTDLLLDLQRGAEGPPVTLVDVSGVSGFKAVVDDEHELILAAGVTHGQIVGDSLLRDAVLPLAQACAEIGSPQLRNRATIAGNLITASPANDTLSALIALDAWVELSRTKASGGIDVRRLPLTGFITGFRETALEAHELLTTIGVPKLRSTQRGMWVKLGLRKAQAISVVHGGIVLTFAEDHVAGQSVDDLQVVEARLALGSVAATVDLIPAFADALVGQSLTDAAIDSAAEAAAASIAPITDGRATADYRQAAVVPLVRRALRTLRAGSEASMWVDSAPVLAPNRLATKRPRRNAVDDTTPVVIRVNGDEYQAPMAASQTLLEWLRSQENEQGETVLSGTKEGCAEGECGACTVQLDDAAVMSCLVSAAQADGSDVVTVEGLAGDAQIGDLQQAFIDEFAAQCGFCIPGFLVAADRLLAEIPEPSVDQIRIALSGNLCRCTGYYPIVAAVQKVAAERAT